MTVCCTGDVLKSLNVHSKKSCASPSRLPNGALVICFGSFVRFIRIGLHLSCPNHGCQGWAFWQSNKSHGRELKVLSGLKLIFHKKKTCASPSRLPKNTLVVSIGSLVRFITSARVVRIGLHLFCLGFHLSRLGYWSWYCWAFWQSNESHGLTWA